MIRHAEMSDFLWLREHEQHISEETLKTKIGMKEVLVIQENDRIVGWLRYNLFWDNVPFMTKIFLLEEHRRRGLGRELVHYWERMMKEKGFAQVLTTTQSDEEAQHFYRKMGYAEIGGLRYLDEPYELIFFKNI